MGFPDELEEMQMFLSLLCLTTFGNQAQIPKDVKRTNKNEWNVLANAFHLLSLFSSEMEANCDDLFRKLMAV